MSVQCVNGWYLITGLDCGLDCWTGLISSYHMTSIQSNVANLVTVTTLL